jgi:hypothetical protein
VNEKGYEARRLVIKQRAICNSFMMQGSIPPRPVHTILRSFKPDIDSAHPESLISIVRYVSRACRIDASANPVTSFRHKTSTRRSSSPRHTKPPASSSRSNPSPRKFPAKRSKQGGNPDSLITRTGILAAPLSTFIESCKTTTKRRPDRRYAAIPSLRLSLLSLSPTSPTSSNAHANADAHANANAQRNGN